MNWEGIHFWAKTTPDGKPGLSVQDHCLNVGCVGEAIRSCLPESVRRILPPGCSILAAGHDIGKITVGFLRKCPDWLVENGLAEEAIASGWQFSESNHAAVSQNFFVRKLPRGKIQNWAVAVGGHHGRFLGQGPVGRKEIEATGLQPEREKLFTWLTGLFGSLPELPPESDEQLLLVAGWITVSDWLGSNEFFFPLGTTYTPEKSAKLAESALRTIRWGKGALRLGVEFGELFADGDSPRFEANSLQQVCLETIRQPGLYIIEAPMGCGKTEAALAAAYRLIANGQNHGVYFALPTQLTSNRIHERVEAFLRNALAEETDHPLAHANSWLQQDLQIRLLPAAADAEANEHAEQGRSWFASSRQALLARYGVGTIDQALLGAVAAKYLAVRLFGLAGKVVILDEVHSYDAYTGSVMDRLIERLLALRCTVIILSATLTAQRRTELLALAGAKSVSPTDAYPLVSLVNERGEVESHSAETSRDSHRTVQVSCRPQENAELLEPICAAAEAGACVLLIKNTVAEAQTLYEQLNGTRREGGPEIGLLHSRFPQFQREQQETKWMAALRKGNAARPRGCVLVATQVVEQSVDIDADLLITDLAPTDMLLQRLGRLWRHPREQRPRSHPEVWILRPEFPVTAEAKTIKAALGKSARVYAPYVLLRSLEVWQHRQAVKLPNDIRALLEATYAEQNENDEPPGWISFRRELAKQIAAMRNKAVSRTNIFENIQLRDEEGVQTRWDDFPSGNLLLLTAAPEPTNHGDVALRFLNGESLAASSFEWRFPVAAAIHRNSVRLPLYAIRSALGTEAQPDWLRLHFKGTAVFGVLDPDDGAISIPASDPAFALEYQTSTGVKIARVAKPTEPAWKEEDDESWF